MPSLIITQDTVTVNLHSKHLTLVNRKDLSSNNQYIKIDVPLIDVDRLIICGRPSISIPVLQRLMKIGIPTFFITSRGRWIGAISPDNNMNAERRIRQYEFAKINDVSLKIAKKLIFAKLRNSRRVLQRLAANRDISHHLTHCNAMDKIKELAKNIENSSGMDVLRGYEGMGAAIYFEQLSKYFPENVPFTTRNRRPPKDAANALMSWTYAIVQGEIDGAIRSHGLDSCIGFLHSISHGTPSLALDLLEPFRAPCCDMIVLNLLNHKHLNLDDFEFRTEDGGTYLTLDARKTFFQTYEMTMARKFTPYQEDAHVDFREVIKQSVFNILKALEGNFEFNFFLMP